MVAMVSLPLWRRWCVKVRLVDDPGHRKIHDTSVPLAGGLTVFTALLAPLLLASFSHTGIPLFLGKLLPPEQPSISSAPLPPS